MSSEIAIKVENLSKCYQIYEQPHDRLKQFIFPRLQGLVGQPIKQYFREFWALKDISFEVKRGETVGIVGRNGSGKSTLLQLICGTLNQSGGLIKTTGRIAALLELGSGFNPEFTGRENVYLNAAVLGLSKGEIDHHFNSIAAFADIGDFMEQAVKTYSSGMVVRLAFAVQAQINPDILIVDEALAVGDAKFQAKCFERLRQLKEGGASILLVTHSTEQIVTHTTRAILLDGGSIVENGEPRFIVNRYLDLLFGRVRKENSLSDSINISPVVKRVEDMYCLDFLSDSFDSHLGHNSHEYRWGDGRAKILDFYLTSGEEIYPTEIESGQTISLAVSIRFYEAVIRPILGITIKTKEGLTVYGANTETLEIEETKSFGNEATAIMANISFVCRLAPGDYFISLGIASRQEDEVIPHDRRYDAIHFQVATAKTFFGIADLELKLKISEISL